MEKVMENCPSLKCFYSVLGVEKDSSAAEIRTAYRKLAMRWHPDKCSNAKGEAREQAKHKFQVVQEAYSVLSDDTKRLMYDHGLDVDVDPSFHDFMEELINKMKEASSSCSKNSADEESEEVMIRHSSAAETENYVQGFKQFDLKAGTSCPEQPNTHQPLASDSPPRPHPNLFKFNGFPDDCFWGDCVNEATQFTREFEQQTPSCPQPHPNLHGVRDLLDHIADHWLDGEFLDLISTQASVLREPQTSHVIPAEDGVNVVTQNNFASALQTSITENSTTPVCSAASVNLSSESFCMGVGEGPGRDYRGNGKSARCRRKKR